MPFLFSWELLDFSFSVSCLDNPYSTLLHSFLLLWLLIIAKCRVRSWRMWIRACPPPIHSAGFCLFVCLFLLTLFCVPVTALGRGNPLAIKIKWPMFPMLSASGRSCYAHSGVELPELRIVLNKTAFLPSKTCLWAEFTLACDRNMRRVTSPFISYLHRRNYPKDMVPQLQTMPSSCPGRKQRLWEKGLGFPQTHWGISSRGCKEDSDQL